MKYIDTWDLEAVFPGGTKSAELAKKLHTIKEQLQVYERLILEWNMTAETGGEPLKAILKQGERIEKGLGQARAFVQMWQDAYMDDEYASVVMGQVLDLASEEENLSNLLTKRLS